jgi:hypothetical protein
VALMSNPVTEVLFQVWMYWLNTCALWQVPSKVRISIASHPLNVS